MNAENQEFRKKMNSLNRMMQDWLKLCRKLRHKLTVGIVDLWHHLWHQKFGTSWSVGMWDAGILFLWICMHFLVQTYRFMCMVQGDFAISISITLVWIKLVFGGISATWHILTPSPDTLVLPTKEPYIRICRLIRCNLERQRESVPIPQVAFFSWNPSDTSRVSTSIPQNRRNRDFPMFCDVVFVVSSCLLEDMGPFSAKHSNDQVVGELNGNERAWWSPAATREATYFQHVYLGGGNSKIFYFHPDPWGRWTNFDQYFSTGWFNHQLVMIWYP